VYVYVCLLPLLQRADTAVQRPTVPNWLSGAEDCAPRTQLIPWSSVSAAFALVLDPNSSNSNSSSSNNNAAANGHSSAANHSAASGAQHTISAPQTLDTSSGSSSGFAVGKLQAFSCAPSSPQQPTATAAAAAASNGVAAGVLHTDSAAAAIMAAAAAAAPAYAATAAAAASALQTAGSDSMRGIAAPQFWLVGSRQHEVSAYYTTSITCTATLSSCQRTLSRDSQTELVQVVVVCSTEIAPIVHKLCIKRDCGSSVSFLHCYCSHLTALYCVILLSCTALQHCRRQHCLATAIAVMATLLLTLMAMLVMSLRKTSVMQPMISVTLALC
jgi:hypothetical protein